MREAEFPICKRSFFSGAHGTRRAGHRLRGIPKGTREYAPEDCQAEAPSADRRATVERDERQDGHGRTQLTRRTHITRAARIQNDSNGPVRNHPPVSLDLAKRDQPTRADRGMYSI